MKDSESTERLKCVSFATNTPRYQLSGATLDFMSNSFWRDLKTNKVKYIKQYIFRKEISQGIYLNSQSFG